MRITRIIRVRKIEFWLAIDTYAYKIGAYYASITRVCYAHSMSTITRAGVYQLSGHVQNFLKNTMFSPFPLKNLYVTKIDIAILKIGQSQTKVMIYTNHVGPESLMLHTKFHWNRSTVSREEDF